MNNVFSISWSKFASYFELLKNALNLRRWTTNCISSFRFCGVCSCSWIGRSKNLRNSWRSLIFTVSCALQQQREEIIDNFNFTKNKLKIVYYAESVCLIFWPIVFIRTVPPFSTFGTGRQQAISNHINRKLMDNINFPFTSVI